MGSKIFYFSGTGNSLAIARAIADRLGDSAVLAMAKHLGGIDVADSDRLGIICPVYAWGPPRMVKDFVKSLTPGKNQYIFAIANCGGTPGKSLVFIDTWLRSKGARLSAGFLVRGDFMAELPGMSEIAVVRLARWLGRKHTPANFRDRIEEIVQVIEKKEKHPVEKSNLAVNVLTAPMYGVASKAFSEADKVFSVTDKCVSCGTCSEVCPRGNVKLIEDHPTWHQDCESCYACFLWCPQGAIALSGHAPNEPRHHPDIAVSDMLLR